MAMAAPQPPMMGQPAPAPGGQPSPQEAEQLIRTAVSELAMAAQQYGIDLMRIVSETVGGQGGPSVPPSAPPPPMM
jgi:hypothetical protein